MKSQLRLYIIYMIGFMSLLIFYSNLTTIHELTNRSKAINNTDSDFTSFLKFLNDNNLFLVGYDKLKEIEIYKNTKNLKLDFHLFFRQSKSVSLGIFNRNITNFFKVLKSKK